MSLFAILPLKPFAGTKTRLSAALAPAQRQALAGAMAEDVLAALAGASTLAGILVVSREPTIAGLAGRYGADVLDSRGDTDLNTAISLAFAEIETAGGNRAMVIHGDLPLLTAADIDTAGRVTGRTTIAAQRARCGRGTTLLSLPLPAPITPAFGDDSFERHERGAARQRCDFVSLDLANTAFDIDTPDDLNDLAALLAAGTTTCGKETADILIEFGLVKAAPDN